MVAGIERETLTVWLTDQLGMEPPVSYELITGGNSNLTYRVTDAGGRTVALRRPPLGSVLQSAHDMAREHRVIAALARTAVPVPEPLAMCADDSVTGAPFYVMGFVEGIVPHDADGGSLIPEDDRLAVSDHLIDIAAELHTIDPEDVGLGDFGRREGYIERQLSRWAKQWEASKQREVAAMDEVRRRLGSNVPSQQRSAIVHGDFRLGNAIVAGGRIAAMLDWELCTLGDPLADIGYLLNSWARPDEPVIWRSSASQAGGYRDRAALVDRYQTATGLDLTGIGYYEAFQAWRLAAILEGVYARYRHGAMGGSEGIDLDLMADSVVALADKALAAL